MEGAARPRRLVHLERPSRTIVTRGKFAITVGGDLQRTRSRTLRAPATRDAPDFWLVSSAEGGDSIGYLTSPWHAPELGCNIALGYVPVGISEMGRGLTVSLPDEYAERAGQVRAVAGVRDSVPSVGQPERERESLHCVGIGRAYARGKDATI